MKKFISVTLSLMLLTSVLSSCSEMGNESTTNGTDTEQTSQNMSASGTENPSGDTNVTATEQGASATPSFG